MARDFKLLDRELQCGKIIESFLGRSFDFFSKLVSGSSDDGKGRTGTRIPAFKSINQHLTITASFEILKADQAVVMVKHH